MTNAERILLAPFTRRARAELAYWLTSIPLAVADIVFTVPMLANGILWAASAPGVRKLATANRALARRRLGENIPAPASLKPVPCVHVRTPDAARLAALARAEHIRVHEYRTRVTIIGRPLFQVTELAASEHIAVYGLRSHRTLSWMRGAMFDRVAWRARVYFALKLPLAAIGLAIARDAGSAGSCT